MEKLIQANDRLKAGKVGVRIEQVGDRIALRATLPPKPQCNKTSPYQQRIYLGIYANNAGISYAEAEAKKVGALIAQDKFDWLPYLKEIEQPTNQVPIVELIEKFKTDYFAKADRAPITWQKNYEEVFKRLPAREPLTQSVVLETVMQTKPDTRTRKRYCLALRSLAKFAGIPLGDDFNSYIGNYSPTKVQPRDIPTDELIQEWFHLIPTPSWQWAYGILATYGIRPSELAFLNFDSMPILEIMAGKTGDRRVYPIFPEWVEMFDLVNPKQPNVQKPGNAANRQFWKYKVPFAPYDLRHAWAIRSMEFGLPIELAAQQMGHSMAIHSETYHRWISDRHHARAYETIMLRPDRPRPPQKKDEKVENSALKS